MSDYAWLYLFYNKSMPNYFKINIWNGKSLIEKLNILNDEVDIPTQYTIVQAKKISNSKQKLKSLYKLINKYRVNKNKDFFRIKKEEIILFFYLIDGEIWIKEKDSFSSLKKISCIKSNENNIITKPEKLENKIEQKTNNCIVLITKAQIVNNGIFNYVFEIN